MDQHCLISNVYAHSRSTSEVLLSMADASADEFYQVHHKENKHSAYIPKTLEINLLAIASVLQAHRLSLC